MMASLVGTLGTVYSCFVILCAQHLAFPIHFSISFSKFTDRINEINARSDDGSKLMVRALKRLLFPNLCEAKEGKMLQMAIVDTRKMYFQFLKPYACLPYW